MAHDTSTAPLTHCTVDGTQHTFSDATALDSFCSDFASKLLSLRDDCEDAVNNVATAADEAAAESARDTYLGSL